MLILRWKKVPIDRDKLFLKQKKMEPTHFVIISFISLFPVDLDFKVILASYIWSPNEAEEFGYVMTDEPN